MILTASHGNPKTAVIPCEVPTNDCEVVSRARKLRSEVGVSIKYFISYLLRGLKEDLKVNDKGVIHKEQHERQDRQTQGSMPSHCLCECGGLAWYLIQSTSDHIFLKT